MTVRVLFYSSRPLNFRLIFPDNCEKDYAFDDYGIRAFRGLNERQIIEQCAAEYLTDIGEPVDNISLIFL